MGFYHDMSQAMLLILLTECSESHMGLAVPALGTMRLRPCYYYYYYYYCCCWKV